MTDAMDQSFQENESISLRVNGEIFNSIKQNESILIKNVVCVGRITNMDGNNIEIQLDDAFSYKYKKGPNVKIENLSDKNYYQFSINVKDGFVEYVHDFGSDFDLYSYSTSFFNYWYILKDRYPQLRGEAPMDQ